MPSEITRDVVTRYFQAVGAGDRDAALALVADRVDWGGAGDESIPWIGARSSKSDVAEFLTLLADNLRTEQADIKLMMVDGDDAVVIVAIDQTVVRTGRSFTGEIAFHITVTDGRITRYRYYEDSLALTRAWTD